jgi:RNA polymerase sigma-70 factor (ECF subfamily)
VVIEPDAVNGEPGARLLAGDGSLLGVLTLHVAGGRITSIGNQINPDKLAHLGRVGDLTALIRGPEDG